MESEAESKELRDEFQQKKRDLSLWRSQITAISTEKEKTYHALKSVQNTIRTLIDTIKNCKEERDKLTSQVKSLKGEREKLNLAVKEKADEKKKVVQKREEITTKLTKLTPSTKSTRFEPSQNPAQIKAHIAALERTIETEVMPFSEEKKLTKKIKELQTQYKKMEELGGLWKEVHAVAADFSQTRRVAEETHHNVQVLAQESQKKHEEMRSLYEQLKSARTQEKPLKDNYLDLKKKFEELRKQGEEISKRVQELSKVFQEEEGKSFRHIAEQKKAQVQEKLKKGKKLSTEDILAFQASKE